MSALSSGNPFQGIITRSIVSSYRKHHVSPLVMMFNKKVRPCQPPPQSSWMYPCAALFTRVSTSAEQTSPIPSAHLNLHARLYERCLQPISCSAAMFLIKFLLGLWLVWSSARIRFTSATLRSVIGLPTQESSFRDTRPFLKTWIPHEVLTTT